MEFILALVVVAAVIFFGALLSLGNERQRKAIDELREQVVLWAMQDLRIKRERLVRDVQVKDPLAWLNGLASKVCEHNLRLEVIESFAEPNALLCTDGNSNEKIVFSPHSPKEINQMKRNRAGNLSRYGHGNPLLSLSKKAAAHELSILNGGFLFDVELPLAWQGLTHQEVDQWERLWMYEFS